MKDSHLSLFLGVFCLGAFFLAQFFIDNLQSIKIDLPETYSLADLFEKTKNQFQFKGTWIDQQKKINQNFSTFPASEGIAFLRVNEYQNPGQFLNNFLLNEANQKPTYLIEVWILSGYELGARKMKFQILLKDLPQEKWVTQTLTGPKNVSSQKPHEDCLF